MGGQICIFTEYFRIREGFKLERPILKSITHNPTGKPAVAQMIGNHVPSLIAAACELQRYPVAAIDLNLGCPAPAVYKKCAGGGLLREPARIDTILGALRAAIDIPFTVKTRIGLTTLRSLTNYCLYSINIILILSASTVVPYMKATVAGYTTITLPRQSKRYPARFLPMATSIRQLKPK